jgi:hypothetical protein
MPVVDLIPVMHKDGIITVSGHVFLVIIVIERLHNIRRRHYYRIELI